MQLFPDHSRNFKIRLANILTTFLSLSVYLRNFYIFYFIAANPGVLAQLEAERNERNNKQEEIRKLVEELDRKDKEKAIEIENSRKLDGKIKKLKYELEAVNKTRADDSKKAAEERRQMEEANKERDELMTEIKRLEEKIVKSEKANKLSMEQCRKAEEQKHQLNEDKIKLLTESEKILEEKKKLEQKVVG
jgi:uncharacterized coiled-coil DUF342 family protein